MGCKVGGRGGAGQEGAGRGRGEAGFKSLAVMLLIVQSKAHWETIVTIQCSSKTSTDPKGSTHEQDFGKRVSLASGCKLYATAPAHDELG